jgi:hypothetical protein
MANIGDPKETWATTAISAKQQELGSSLLGPIELKNCIVYPKPTSNGPVPRHDTHIETKTTSPNQRRAHTFSLNPTLNPKHAAIPNLNSL